MEKCAAISWRASSPASASMRRSWRRVGSAMARKGSLIGPPSWLSYASNSRDFCAPRPIAPLKCQSASLSSTSKEHCKVRHTCLPRQYMSPNGVLSTGPKHQMHPCYTLDNKSIVLIQGFKNYCALLFPKGALMNDPHTILVRQTPNVQLPRQIRFTSAQQIQEMRAVIKAYVDEAIRAEKSGVEPRARRARSPGGLSPVVGQEILQPHDGAGADLDLGLAVVVMQLADKLPAPPAGGKNFALRSDGDHFDHPALAGGNHRGRCGVFCAKAHRTSRVDAHAQVDVAAIGQQRRTHAAGARALG